MRTLTIFFFCLGMTLVRAETAVNSTPQTRTPLSISSKGGDVRKVLYALFTNSKKSFVCDIKNHQPLYLSLHQVSFDQALAWICQVANLRYKLQNGVYFIYSTSEPGLPYASLEKKDATNIPGPKDHELQKDTPVKKTIPDLQDIPKIAKPLPASALQRRITIRMSKAKIGAVISELGHQAKLLIEVDPSVPNYTLDAYLMNTSLKYALDTISKKANLTYNLTDRGTIKINKIQK